MGVYSNKSRRGGGGGKDKVFLKEFLGRIRNFGEKCLFLVIFCLFLDGFEEIFSNFRVFLRKLCLLQGLFVFSPPRSSGRIGFQEIEPRKDKDFMLEYTPMLRTPGLEDSLLFHFELIYYT